MIICSENNLFFCNWFATDPADMLWAQIFSTDSFCNPATESPGHELWLDDTQALQCFTQKLSFHTIFRATIIAWRDLLQRCDRAQHHTLLNRSAFFAQQTERELNFDANKFAEQDETWSTSIDWTSQTDKRAWKRKYNDKLSCIVRSIFQGGNELRQEAREIQVDCSLVNRFVASLLSSFIGNNYPKQNDIQHTRHGRHLIFLHLQA